MSKIGRLPIAIKSGVNIAVENNIVKISGVKGEAVYTIPSGIKAVIEEGKLVLSLVNEKDVTRRAMYGLTRANLANIIKGIDAGFEKKLELTGVGYRAQMQGNDLVLSLGFSHPVKFSPEPGVKISVAESTISVAGTDKAAVGLTAAKIRAIKPPEPYKGKGIKYKGEHIRRKAGKAAKAVGGK
jgi:large subunit ribosomal protein L6